MKRVHAPQYGMRRVRPTKEQKERLEIDEEPKQRAGRVIHSSPFEPPEYADEPEQIEDDEQ